MLTSELFERVQQDVDAHEKASTVFHNLASYVYNGGKSDFDVQIKDQHFYAFRPETIDLGFDDAFVMVGLRNRKSSVMAGAIMGFSGEPVLGKYKHALVVYCLRELTEQSMRATINSTDFIHTFEHEYIHLLDFKRSDNAIISKQEIDPNDRSRYYNDPAEFNAYFHTFGGHWLSILRQIKAEPAAANDIKELYDITGDFTNDLQQLMRATSQSKTFFKSLSERNRKRIIQRLYQVYHQIQSVGTPSGDHD